MPQAFELFDQYLEQHHTMVLATVRADGPSSCPVYFVPDEAYNFHWTSLPSRRHSQDIACNPLVAASIVVQDTVGEPTIGIQLRGSAEHIAPSRADRLTLERYATRFALDDTWVEALMAGQTQHQLYRLTPYFIKLRDEVHFPEEQERVILDTQPALRQT